MTIPVILLAATAQHAGSINWGDVPTWLAVFGAAAAALIAFVQLHGQRGEIARQTRQLERQQASQVEVLVRPGQRIPLPPDTHQDKHALYVANVTNASPRPIRNVTAGIVLMPSHGASGGARTPTVEPVPWRPVQVQLWRQDESGARQYRDVQDKGSIPLVRPTVTASLVFPVPVTTEQDVEPVATVRFTDDADLHWEIDPNLRLKKLLHRDW